MKNIRHLCGKGAMTLGWLDGLSVLRWSRCHWVSITQHSWHVMVKCSVVARTHMVSLVSVTMRVPTWNLSESSAFMVRQLLLVGSICWICWIYNSTFVTLDNDAGLEFYFFFVWEIRKLIDINFKSAATAPRYSLF